MYRLIVTEPSSSVQKIIRLAFPENEFEIHPFSGGQDMLKSLAHLAPDAVLLNLSLPDSDAYEMGRYFQSQKNFRDIPLVFLLGAFDVCDEERLGRMTHDGIVREPFDSAELVRRVRTLIGERKTPLTLPEEPLPDPAETAELCARKAREQGDRRMKTQTVDLVEEVKKRVLSEVKSWWDRERGSSGSAPGD